MTMTPERARETLADSKWTHPSDYGGHSPDGDYVIYGRNRDSSILENVNYREILEDLENIADSRCYDFRAGHWAVGWVEYIVVPNDSPDVVILAAAEIVAALADYPVWNEESYSEAQYNAMHEYWEQCSIRERTEHCQESGDSIFAARRDDIPEFVMENLSQHEMFY
jgi:acyl-CoA synthetase (AMP-forming)/AMP-acid ligase II